MVMVLRECVLRESIEVADILIPAGEKLSIVYRDGSLFLQISFCVSVDLFVGLGIFSVHRMVLIKLTFDEILKLFDLGLMTQASLLHFIMTASIKKMVFRGMPVKSYVDMVGYIKNIPVELFEVIEGDNGQYVVVAYGTCESLIELEVDGER